MLTTNFPNSAVKYRAIIGKTLNQRHLPAAEKGAKMTSFECTFRNLKYRMILLFAMLTLLPALAYADTLSVTTNKATYGKGEVMKITAVFKNNAGTANHQCLHP